jgi:hypothetical protein
MILSTLRFFRTRKARRSQNQESGKGFCLAVDYETRTVSVRLIETGSKLRETNLSCQHTLK